MLYFKTCLENTKLTIFTNILSFPVDSTSKTSKNSKSPAAPISKDKPKNSSDTGQKESPKSRLPEANKVAKKLFSSEDKHNSSTEPDSQFTTPK